MSSRNQTILGYALVAVICLVIGFFAGQEYVKYEIRSAFKGAAKAMSSAFETSLGDESAPIESGDLTSASNSSLTEAKVRAQKIAYIQNRLKLYEFHAEYMGSLLDGKVPAVTFKIKNKGNRTLNEVEVTVYFKNAQGVTISEESYTPVLVTEFGFGDNDPLKLGYIWQMEQGHFYSAKSVPSEWQEGSAAAEITYIEFANTKQSVK